MRDSEHSGWPAENTTTEIINKIYDLGISSESKDNILLRKMKKLTARLMPRLVTVDKKREQVACSRERFAGFSVESTMGSLSLKETWVHYYKRGTKE